MPVSRRVPLFHQMVASLSIAAILSPMTAVAQNPTPGQPAQAGASLSTPNNPPNGPTPQVDYSKPASVMSIIGPYKGREVPTPVYSNSPRLDQLLQNGKLMLSLDNAIALALENNYDIAIARYNFGIADTDILLAKAGGTIRGVNTGLLTGTPGGSGTTTSTTGSSSTAGAQGGGSGGTTTGTGGAGSVGGVVASTTGTVGSAIDPYDPTITAALQLENSMSPVTNPAFYGGLTNISERLRTYNFSVSQGWSTGTLAQLTWDNSRTSSNIPAGFTTFNPLLNSNWRVTVRQHLLQGFGIENNRRQIIIAQNDKKVTDSSFRQQIMSTVAQIQNIYWDLVNAYENVKVQQTALQFANRTLSDNKKQVEIGTLAPIEVVSAQSQVATATQNLITAQTNLQYQQLLMKNAISRNLQDPTLATAEVVPTDTMTVSNEALPPVDELVNMALKNRPEIEQSELNLRNQEISMKAARNALLPTVDLVGFYGGSGLSNNYGDVFSGIVNRTAPDRGAALSLSIPVRNRAAQATQIRSELEHRQNQLLLQQQKNQITIQVRQAHYALQNSIAGVEAARAARDYAQQNLEAEQKKYALGASTSYLVLQQQSNATQAASNYVAALSTYEKARVTLDQVTATVLDRNGISMQDAATGQVTREPSVPNLVPNTTPGTVQTQPAGTPPATVPPPQAAPQQQPAPQK